MVKGLSVKFPVTLYLGGWAFIDTVGVELGSSYFGCLQRHG